MIEGKKCPLCGKGVLKKFKNEAEPEIFVNAFRCSNCKEIWYSEAVTKKLEAMRKGSSQERKLVRVGNSIAAVIPSNISKKLKLKAKETVYVREENGEIRIKAQRAKA